MPKKIQDIKSNRRPTKDFIDALNDAKQNEIKKEKKIDREIIHTAPTIGARRIGGIRPKRRTHSKRPIFIYILILLILGGSYGLATFFRRADVRIVAKHQSFNLDQETFTASKDPNALPFEIMIVPGKEYKELSLTQTETVSNRSKGQITFYNTYSTKPQKLSANTFIADDSGKTYKTDQAISIPGYTLDQSKAIIPGQASVSITAFLSGDSYNGNPTNFYVTSYKNTDRYKKIYAKAISAITGGAVGAVYILGPNEKGFLNAEAISTFRSNLLKKVNAEIPPHYILYPDAMTFSYQVDEAMLSPTPDAKAAITGTLSAVIFKDDLLSSYIIRRLIPSISPAELAEVQIPGMKDLKFSFTDQSQTITKDLQSISFALSGPLDANWQPNIEGIRASLAGVRKENASDIFKLDPGVSNAYVSMFPPWLSTIPTDISRIHITLE